MKNTVSRQRSRPAFLPRLESLEARLTPTTYTVSSLADTGAGSLRAAITSVDSDTSPDEINFSAAGVIQLTSGALPPITNTVKIDGTTAPGFANNPMVEIDNHGYAGLILNGPNSSLASLSIVNADGPGVTLEGNSITVVGNWIGLALDGSVAANTGFGLYIDTSTGDFIGGTTALDRNVISGNGAGGIQLGNTLSSGDYAQNVNVLGNYIGTDPTGQQAARNQGDGITVTSSENVIGTGNVIAFNTQAGVAIFGQQDGVLGNSIFDNETNGIYLGPPEMTVTAGGNPYSPAPQISYVKESSGPSPGSSTVQVFGGLYSYPDINGQGYPIGATYQIQVFASLASTAPGQGQLFLGTVSVTTNSTGYASFTLSNASVPAGDGTTFTATATSQENSTSAFSAAAGVSTPNQIYVANVYQQLLNRIPDPSAAGWVNALNNGDSAAGVVLGVESGTEYLSDQVFALYNRYLNRNPDSAGEQAWTNFLLAGGTLEQVAEGMTSSLEYFALQGNTNQGFVTGLYQEVLNRTPSDAEVAGWVSALDNGASRLSVSTGFLTSQEYRSDLVQADYLTFLLRPADDSGLNAWVDALNAGATDQQVLAQIFGSAEGYQIWA